MRGAGIEPAADLVMQSSYWKPAPVERDAIRDVLARAGNGDPPQ